MFVTSARQKCKKRFVWIFTTALPWIAIIFEGFSNTTRSAEAVDVLSAPLLLHAWLLVELRPAARCVSVYKCV